MNNKIIILTSILLLSVPTTVYTVNAANSSYPGQGLYYIDRQLNEVQRAFLTSTQGEKGKANAFISDLTEGLIEVEALQKSQNRKIQNYKQAYDTFTEYYKNLSTSYHSLRDKDSDYSNKLGKNMIKIANDYYDITYPHLAEIKDNQALYNIVFESTNTVTDYAYEIASENSMNTEADTSLDDRTKTKLALDSAYLDYLSINDINEFGIAFDPNQSDFVYKSTEQISNYYNQASEALEKNNIELANENIEKLARIKSQLYSYLNFDKKLDGFDNVIEFDFAFIDGYLAKASESLNSAQNASKARRVDYKNAEKYLERARLKHKLLKLLDRDVNFEEIKATRDSILDDIQHAQSLAAKIIQNPETPIIIEYKLDNTDDQIIKNNPTPIIQASTTPTPIPTQEEFESEEEYIEDFEYENEYEYEDYEDREDEEDDEHEDEEEDEHDEKEEEEDDENEHEDD